MASKNIVFKKISKDKSVSSSLCGLTQVWGPRKRPLYPLKTPCQGLPSALKPPEGTEPRWDRRPLLRRANVPLLGLRWEFIWENGTLWIASTVWIRSVSWLCFTFVCPKHTWL